MVIINEFDSAERFVTRSLKMIVLQISTMNLKLQLIIIMDLEGKLILPNFTDISGLRRENIHQSNTYFDPCCDRVLQNCIN